MSKVRFYLNPIQTTGSYGDYVDVSTDVSLDSLSNITSKLEGSEYDVGVITLSSIKIRLNNISGSYSESTDLRSIFPVARSGTKVRVTWQKGNDDAVCNFSVCGVSYPYVETIIYEGLLSDESSTTDLTTNYTTFDVLSYSSELSRVETPFDSLVDGQTVSEMMTILLAEFSDIFTVGDISPQYDAVIDTVEDFEDTVVDEVIADLLKASNSVLYFDIDTVYVKGRVETDDVKRTFYGQSSNLGVEDVIKLSKIKSGLSRTFNLWRWDDTTVVSRNSSSIEDYGSRVKDFDISPITTEATQQAILDDFKDEFSLPKREFTLQTFMDVETLISLDKINIDYPTPYYVPDGDVFPIYGKSRYGTARYPFGEYGLTLTTNEYFKIMSVTIDLRKDLVTYGLREI